MTVTNVTNTSQEYQVPQTGTNVAYEIADFLFGVRSIEKIAKGEGSWGDLVNVGVTAATFLIPPAKLATLGKGALRKVIKETVTVHANTKLPPAAINAAQRTIDNALEELLKRGDITPDEIAKMKKTVAGQKAARKPKLIQDETVRLKQEEKILGKYPEEKFVPEGKPIDKTTDKTYTRQPEQDLPDDVMPQEIDPLQEVEDFTNTQRVKYRDRATGYETLPKEVRLRREAEAAGRYDKTKFTPEEIQDRIDNLRPDELELLKGKSRAEVEDYVRGGQYTSKEILTAVEQAISKSKTALAKADKDTIANYNLYAKNNLEVPEYLQKAYDDVVFRTKFEEESLIELNRLLPEEIPSIQREAVDVLNAPDWFEILPDGKVILRKIKTVDEEIIDATLKDVIPNNAWDDLAVTQQNKIMHSVKLKLEIAKLRNYKTLKPEQEVALSNLTKTFNKIRLTNSEKDVAILIYKDATKQSIIKGTTKRGGRPDIKRAEPGTTESITPSKSVGKNSDITVHSGMAEGADTVWATEADKLGIKTIGHSFKEHSVRGTRPKLETRNILSKEQLKEADVALKKANETLKRPTGNLSEYTRDLFRRNYYQVKDSEAVIAVGKILPEGKLVDGGTGWAVQMGIDMGKPVYVFDQEVGLWAKWTGTKFEKIEFPKPYKTFAGIGTRKLNDKGRKAIKEYLDELKRLNNKDHDNFTNFYSEVRTSTKQEKEINNKLMDESFQNELLSDYER